MAGSLAIILRPGPMVAALTRIADATLRNSIHRSSMEIVCMGVPANLQKAIKTFLDVVIERIRDASAGLIILLVSISSMASYRAYVHVICVALMVLGIDPAVESFADLPISHRRPRISEKNGWLIPLDSPMKLSWHISCSLQP